MRGQTGSIPRASLASAAKAMSTRTLKLYGVRNKLKGRPPILGSTTGRVCKRATDDRRNLHANLATGRTVRYRILAMQSLEFHRRPLAIDPQSTGRSSRDPLRARSGLVAAAGLLLLSAAPFCAGQSAPAPAVAPAVAPAAGTASPTQSPAPVSPSTAAAGSLPRPSGVPPATSTAASAVPGVDVAHYIIGAEDSLQITVWKEPTLSGTIPVRPDGMISLVLGGRYQSRRAGLPCSWATDITPES